MPGRRETLGLLLALPLLRHADAQPSFSRLLLERYPRLTLPWRDLGGLPTALEPSELLSRRLGADISIKRDDLAGEIYGGSKARKLELFLADAIERGAREVLTFGAAGSNQALATAIHARRLGLRCRLRLLPETPSDHVREHLLAEQTAGAQIEIGRRADLDAPSSDGVYAIPLGGTSPLGNVGYVECGLELAARNTRADRVYIAAGTTGAAAGLFVGLRAAGLRCELVAVRTSSRASANEARLRAEIEQTSAFLRARDPSFPDVRADAGLHLEHRFAGPGYAHPSEAGARAMAVAAEAGLELDSTYTAKAFAALLADAPRGRVVFVDTYDARRAPSNARPADLPSAFRRYFGRR